MLYLTLIKNYNSYSSNKYRQKFLIDVMLSDKIFSNIQVQYFQASWGKNCYVRVFLMGKALSMKLI